jgi:hypothetical protein
MGMLVWTPYHHQLRITYDLPAGANIKTISGVDWGSVKQVSGVASTDISKISGVAAQ